LIRVEVQDSGIGIPPEKQEHVFQAFSQAEGSTTRRYGGTGLGLTICRQLAELMGGEIGVNSEVGRGSTFWFTARFSLQEEAPPIVQPEVMDTIQDTRILVIDDHSFTRDFLSRMLRSQGLRAEGAPGTAEGLTALQNAAAGDPIQVLLLDADLTLGDGFTFAGQVKAVPLLASTKIILLTAFGQRGDAEKCRAAGIDGYLTKPVRPGDLIGIIKEVLKASPIAQTAPSLVTRHTVRESSPKELVAEKNSRALLVEDNPVNQKLALRLLEKRGYQVLLAGNGREALDLLEREPVDFVLMDVQMPVLDGLEATKIIRDREKGTESHLPIIAMTAHAMKGDRERCLEAGMDHYVAKPIQPEELFAVISRVLEWSSPKVL
jgi:CheY-like chemotaxis protein